MGYRTDEGYWIKPDQNYKEKQIFEQDNNAVNWKKEQVRHQTNLAKNQCNSREW